MTNKTKTITIRLSEEQRAIVEAAAKSNCMSMAEYTRLALLEKTNNKSLNNIKGSSAESGFVNINMMITKEQEEKIVKMAEELDITKQQCIRRLINESNIYDFRINIDMAEEFSEMAYEIRNLNKLLNGIYTVCKRADGVLTKREVEQLFNTINEIKENTSSIRGSIFKTNGQLKEMAAKRLDRLIMENVKGR